MIDNNNNGDCCRGTALGVLRRRNAQQLTIDNYMMDEDINNHGITTQQLVEERPKSS
jgi:hypothetical protein